MNKSWIKTFNFECELVWILFLNTMSNLNIPKKSSTKIWKKNGMKIIYHFDYLYSTCKYCIWHYNITLAFDDHWWNSFPVWRTILFPLFWVTAANDWCLPPPDLSLAEDGNCCFNQLLQFPLQSISYNNKN